MAKKTHRTIKVGHKSFDVVDASGTAGVRFEDRLSHISIELRQYKEGGKSCNRRVAFHIPFPKEHVPEVIDQLSRLALIPDEVGRVQFNEKDRVRLETWKRRMVNAQDRRDLLLLVALMIEVCELPELTEIVHELGVFLAGHKETNPHLIERYRAVVETLFPFMLTDCAAEYLESVQPEGHA